ncbi:MAG: hypothetical protein JW940_04260 [Polyangiaceae bacterium]|nr:hypothetical protein [Polyangiaceae bacterium]
MDNPACTFALVLAAGSAALGCGAGEPFRTAPSSGGAGGASAAAGAGVGQAGRAGAAAGVTAGAGGAAGAAQAAGSQAPAGAAGVAGVAGEAGGAAVAGAAPGAAAGSVGQGGHAASGAGPIGGAGGSSNTEAAGGSEPLAGAAGVGGVAGAAGMASAGVAGADFGPPDMSQIAAPYAQAVCAAVTDCSPELASILLGANDCVDYVTKQLRNAWVPALQVAVNGGTVLYSADELDGCLDAVSGLGCRFDAHDDLAECEAAFQGTREREQSCSIDAECQGDLYCKADGACSGTCSDRGLINDSCQRDSDCRAGLYCGLGGCTERIALNGACYADGGPCEPGSLCQGADASTNTLGHCEPIENVFSRSRYSTCDVGQGQLCAWEQEPTVELTCAFTDENTLPACRERASSGEACRLAVPDACPRQEYCQGVSLEESIFIGQCMPLPGEGKPCVSDLGFGKQCAPNHVCVDGTCVELRENDADCDSEAECFSGACSAGVCVPLTVCK